jgi:hypothetical protein
MKHYLTVVIPQRKWVLLQRRAARHHWKPGTARSNPL